MLFSGVVGNAVPQRMLEKHQSMKDDVCPFLNIHFPPPEKEEGYTTEGKTMRWEERWDCLNTDFFKALKIHDVVWGGKEMENTLHVFPTRTLLPVTIEWTKRVRKRPEGSRRSTCEKNTFLHMEPANIFSFLFCIETKKAVQGVFRAAPKDR